MKQSFIKAKELFPGSDIVRKYTFKTAKTGDHYALLARADHQLSQDFAILGAQYAHFKIKDCFECLPPHEIAV